MGEMKARCAVERRWAKRDEKEKDRKLGREVRDGKRKILGSGCGGMSGGDVWRGIIAEPAKHVKQNQLRSEHNGFSGIRERLEVCGEERAECRGE